MSGKWPSASETAGMDPQEFRSVLHNVGFDVRIDAAVVEARDRGLLRSDHESLTCERVGCDNTFPPTVRRGNRGGRKRRFCSNACAVARAVAKRGGTAILPAKRTYRGEPVYVATADSPETDRLGRPKTLYRFGRTPEEAESRLLDLMDEVYGGGSEAMLNRRAKG